MALPQIGFDGQERIAAATVVVAGDDLAAEVCARALAAAGVGTLRLVRRHGPPSEVVMAALRASNPDLGFEAAAWPAGAAWLTVLEGATAVARSGFDDDAMLRAAVRLGVPAVVVRGAGDTADVISFRKHGPCPHLALDLPEHRATVPPEGPDQGAAAVVAAEIAAAETLVVIAGATVGAARARHVRVGPGGTEGLTRATDIPWTPECFACGGSATEMSFS